MTTKPNRCGECTLCCTLLKVPQLNKEANQDCIHCELNVGCKIWKSRPQVCRDFECAYYQSDSAHLDLRPDNCKMIFEKVNDNIFFGTQDPRFEMTKVARGQIRSFNAQGYSVIVSKTGTKPVIFLAPHHQEKQIKAEYKSHLIEIEKTGFYGSAKLQS